VTDIESVQVRRLATVRHKRTSEVYFDDRLLRVDERNCSRGRSSV
jgi:hypothetical protein